MSFLFFFFAIADLKNFTWCNVIQQIKKVLPKDHKANVTNIGWEVIWQYFAKKP